MNRAEELKARAEAILPDVQKFAHRAFVVELTGTPKAGKSSAVRLLRGFFKQCGYQVHVLEEKAEDCPLLMKGHFYFNTWTTCSTIAEVVEKVEAEVDLLIIDRGLFDALIWLERQKNHGQISQEEFSTFESFVLLDRWRSLTDITLVMSVDAEKAMERERNSRILEREGTVVNPNAISELNDVLFPLIKRHRDQFNVSELDTTASDTRAMTEEIISNLLDELEAFANPDVAVLERSVVEAHFEASPLLSARDAKARLPELMSAARAMRRSVAEKREDVVQIVAGGIPTHRGAVLPLERTDLDDDDSRRSRFVIWKGGHVPYENAVSTDVLNQTVRDRLRDDLHLEHSKQLDLVGLVWDRDQEPRHLGAIFDLPIDDPGVAQGMAKKRFRKYRKGRAQQSRTFAAPATVVEDGSLDHYDPWSQLIIRHLRESNA